MSKKLLFLLLSAQAIINASIPNIATTEHQEQTSTELKIDVLLDNKNEVTPNSSTNLDLDPKKTCDNPTVIEPKEKIIFELTLDDLLEKKKEKAHDNSIALHLDPKRHLESMLDKGTLSQGSMNIESDNSIKKLLNEGSKTEMDLRNKLSYTSYTTTNDLNSDTYFIKGKETAFKEINYQQQMLKASVS